MAKGVRIPWVRKDLGKRTQSRNQENVIMEFVPTILGYEVRLWFLRKPMQTAPERITFRSSQVLYYVLQQTVPGIPGTRK